MKTLSIILIIAVALNVLCMTLYLIRLFEPNTCAGYRKTINELQVEKKQLIQTIAEKDQLITNMADENWLKGL